MAFWKRLFNDNDNDNDQSRHEHRVEHPGFKTAANGWRHNIELFFIFIFELMPRYSTIWGKSTMLMSAKVL